MALVAENDQMTGLNVVQIADEHMGFYCAARPELIAEGWNLIHKLGVAAFPPDQDGYPPHFRKLFKSFGSGWKPAVLSESYEALRALALTGSMVTVLSSRVAAVAQGDLFELKNPATAAAQASGKAAGSYAVSLITDRSLDPAHSAFIAQELRAVMHA
jgi:DNA-binding transcriptional LysR family regulator